MHDHVITYQNVATHAGGRVLEAHAFTSSMTMTTD